MLSEKIATEAKPTNKPLILVSLHLNGDGAVRIQRMPVQAIG
jgi:hypothetical protein